MKYLFTISFILLTTFASGQISDCGIGLPIDSVLKSAHYPPDQIIRQKQYYHFIFNNSKQNSATLYITKDHHGIVIAKVISLPDKKTNLIQIKNFLKISKDVDIKLLSNGLSDWYVFNGLAIQVKFPTKEEKYYTISMVSINSNYYK